MPDPARILVHPGLPEGAWGPVQRFLWANREPLGASLDLILCRDLAEPVRAARHFARHGHPLALGDLAEALEATVPPRLAGDGRDLVIACEALGGDAAGAPAAPGLAGWGALAPVGAVLAGYLAERFPGAEVRLVYTTRADWLERAWVHGLVAGRLRLDRAGFASRLAGADQEEALAGAAAAVVEAAPRAEPFVLAIEEAEAHPLGPGGAFLELLDLPPRALTGLRTIRQPRLPDPAVVAEVLALNRSDLGDRAAREAKRALLDEAGLAPWSQLLSPSAPG